MLFSHNEILKKKNWRDQKPLKRASEFLSCEISLKHSSFYDRSIYGKGNLPSEKTVFIAFLSTKQARITQYKKE